MTLVTPEDVLRALEAAPPVKGDRLKLYQFAQPALILSQSRRGLNRNRDALIWFAGDHPTRANLILEQLGRPERIAP